MYCSRYGHSGVPVGGPIHATCILWFHNSQYMYHCRPAFCGFTIHNTCTTAGTLSGAATLHGAGHSNLSYSRAQGGLRSACRCSLQVVINEAPKTVVLNCLGRCSCCRRSRRRSHNRRVFACCSASPTSLPLLEVIAHLTQQKRERNHWGAQCRGRSEWQTGRDNLRE